MVKKYFMILMKRYLFQTDVDQALEILVSFYRLKNTDIEDIF